MLCESLEPSLHTDIVSSLVRTAEVVEERNRLCLTLDLYRERGAELQAQAAEDKAETDRLGEELAALLAQTRAVEEDKERLEEELAAS